MAKKLIKPSFTKGPWTVVDGFDKKLQGNLFPSVNLGKGELYKGHKPSIVINESHDQNALSIMANAVLISKAPDLFKLLDDISNCISIDMTKPDGNSLRQDAVKLLSEILNIW